MITVVYETCVVCCVLLFAAVLCVVLSVVVIWYNCFVVLVFGVRCCLLLCVVAVCCWFKFVVCIGRLMASSVVVAWRLLFVVVLWLSGVPFFFGACVCFAL